MTDKTTQLTVASNYDVSRMRFSKPITGSIPDSKPAISFQRINILTQNEDGTLGDLVFPVGPCFSFGVSENTSMETKLPSGWTLPICLYNKDGATSEEKEWVETFNNVVEHCKKHLLMNKENIGKYDLEASDLKKFNPLYYQRDKNNKGKIKEDSATLYAKLIQSKKLDKITTMFSDFEGNIIEDPKTLIGKFCTVRAAVKIESIFIGNKISLQVKLYECEVKLIQTGMPRLLSKSAPVPKVLIQKAAKPHTPPSKDEDEDEEDDDAGSITDDTPVVVSKVSDDDDDEVVADLDEAVKPVPKETKKPLRRVKKV
jgi:hypothetical protein